MVSPWGAQSCHLPAPSHPGGARTWADPLHSLCPSGWGHSECPALSPVLAQGQGTFVTSYEGVPLARGPIGGQNRVRTQDAKPRSLCCSPVPTRLPCAGPSAWPSPTLPACYGASSALPPLGVELHPSKRYAEVLTPHYHKMQPDLETGSLQRRTGHDEVGRVA